MERLDLTKLTPAQLAQLQAVLNASAAPEPEVDYSKQPVVMVSHSPAAHAYMVDGDDLVDRDGKHYGPKLHDNFTKDPASNARIGYAPVAYNGKVIESLEHHQGLRLGDSATLKLYATDTDVAGEIPPALVLDGGAS